MLLLTSCAIHLSTFPYICFNKHCVKQAWGIKSAALAPKFKNKKRASGHLISEKIAQVFSRKSKKVSAAKSTAIAKKSRARF
jgi:hypothetical protein